MHNARLFPCIKNTVTTDSPDKLFFVYCCSNSIKNAFYVKHSEYNRTRFKIQVMKLLYYPARKPPWSSCTRPFVFLLQKCFSDRTQLEGIGNCRLQYPSTGYELGQFGFISQNQHPRWRPR